MKLKMADIRDIISWIMRAKSLEESEPLKALAILEAADRKLYELLGKSVFINTPLYNSVNNDIRSGYERCNFSLKKFQRIS